MSEDDFEKEENEEVSEEKVAGEEPEEKIVEDEPEEEVAKEEVIEEEIAEEEVIEEEIAEEEAIEEAEPKEEVIEEIAEEEVIEEEVAEKEPEKLLLKWNVETGQFDPIESDGQMDEGIFIEHIEEAKKWKYFYIEGASLIARRTALRSANGIAKTGYKHPETDVRYGVECKLEEEKSPYEDMPDSLRVAQRAWYTKEPKK